MMISTYSNVAYLAAAVAILWIQPSLSAAVMATALTVLAAGSFMMHHTRDWGPWPAWESWDHVGMHATLAGLATHLVGGPWWLVLLGAAGAAWALEIEFNVDVVTSMGIYVWFAIVGGLVAGDPILLLLGLGLMALGFLAWHHDADLTHGLWHVATAAGIAVLYLAGGT